MVDGHTYGWLGGGTVKGQTDRQTDSQDVQGRTDRCSYTNEQTDGHIDRQNVVQTGRQIDRYLSDKIYGWQTYLWMAGRRGSQRTDRQM